jgi:hypothetical protein
MGKEGSYLSTEKIKLEEPEFYLPKVKEVNNNDNWQ